MPPKTSILLQSDTAAAFLGYTAQAEGSLSYYFSSLLRHSGNFPSSKDRLFIVCKAGERLGQWQRILKVTRGWSTESPGNLRQGFWGLRAKGEGGNGEVKGVGSIVTQVTFPWAN